MLRRDLLLGSAAALAPALTPTAVAAAPSWDAGKLFHLLPTVSDRRLLIKATFTERQSRPPSLRVAGKLVAGKQTDYRGSCWSFDADGLEPARPYKPQIVDSAKKPLCAPWTLKTFPAPSEQPKNFRLLVYTCAGGDERLIASNGKPNNLSLAQRGRLLHRAMTFSPDAVVANGDPIYWDLKQGDYPPRLDDKLIGLTGKFQRDQPVLGTPNGEILRTVADQQIARLYGTRFRGVPVFFLQDDHDYFENDDANDRIVTYPPDHFMLQLGRATRRIYYPEFLPDAQRPIGLPGASASDTPSATGEAFGTIRFGSLAEVRLYDCRWQFHRNSVLDARNFFAPAKPSFRRNQFGGLLSGKLWKDKTFLIMGYEGNRRGQQDISLRALPPVAFRNGNFSSLATPLRNPRGGNFLFPGNIIPASSFSPQGAGLLALYPQPTNAGVNNFNATAASRFMQSAGNGITPLSRSSPFREAQIAGPFSAPTVPDLANMFTATSSTPVAPGIQEDIKTGYINQWSFGVQRELARNLVLDVSYLGSQGHKLPTGWNLTF